MILDSTSKYVVLVFVLFFVVSITWCGALSRRLIDTVSRICRTILRISPRSDPSLSAANSKSGSSRPTSQVGSREGAQRRMYKNECLVFQFLRCFIMKGIEHKHMLLWDGVEHCDQLNQEVQ